MANVPTKFEVCSFGHSEDIASGVKFLPWSSDPDHASFRDGIRGLTLDIAYNHTKFDDSSFSNFRNI